jgi:hypothetical protein
MKLAALGFTLCALASCGAPPVFAGADKLQQTRASRIEGSVIVNTASRGDVLLFLFNAAQPPPPEGSGRPVSFAVLSSDAVFGNAADEDAGPFTAPFSFSLVTPGRYLVRGFVDANADFIPWYSVTNEVNEGDIGGAALDAATHAPRVLEVRTDASGAPLPVTDVPVTISDIARVSADRPAFEVSVPSLALSGPAKVILRAMPLTDALVWEPSACFLAHLVDQNGDGAPDDSNGDGAPDFWPRVAVRKMADDSLLSDEAVALEAGFDFSGILDNLNDANGQVKAAPSREAELALVIKPRAFDISDPAHPVALDAPPAGRYSITVIESTGQTWRVPNELAPALAGPLGLPAVESQAFAIEVRQ